MFETIRNRMESEKGFTLIELLVVILIIGILAAIAIPSFLNQRYKGQDACAKSMVKQMQTAAKTYQTDMNTYVGMTIGSLSAIENSITAATTTDCGYSTTAIGGAATGGACSGNATATAFSVCATSVTTNTFSIAENGTGGVTRGCTVGANANSGGCRAADTAGATGSW